MVDGFGDSRRGYVYVLVNSSMPGIVKVGRTTRAPHERAAELSGPTGVPSPYVVAFEQFFADCLAAEKQLHAELASRGFRVSDNREFFRASPNEVIRLMMGMQGHAEPDGVATADSLDEIGREQVPDEEAAQLLRLVQVAYNDEGPEADEARTFLDERFGHADVFGSRAGEELVEAGDDLASGANGSLMDLDEAAETFRAAIEAGSLEAYGRLADVLFDQAHEAFMEDRERLHDRLRREAMKVLKTGAKAGNYYCWLDLGKAFLEDKNVDNACVSFRNFFEHRRKAIAQMELALEPPPGQALAAYLPGCWRYVSLCLSSGHPIDHLDELTRVRRSLVDQAELMLRIAKERRYQHTIPGFEAVLAWCKENLLDGPAPWLAALMDKQRAASAAPRSTKPQQLPGQPKSNDIPVAQLGYRGLAPESFEDLTDDAILDDEG